MSVNKVIVLGRLGQDPELKYTPSGAAVCNFSVATSDSWTDKEGKKQEKTEWHRIVVWGKLAELCNQYLSKGKQAYVEGKLETRSWDKDGTKMYTTEVKASTVQFLGQSGGGAPSSSDEGSSESSGGGEEVAGDFTSDDIPF